ncbi:breast cancer type 2 susceptibility protein [Nematolebias whitei]|uniref:breast cancer type 2 susceptibility protein n=1 Tax=Nematolebias whitei TaxID=451745 RepID=UPI001898EBEF|nr:breast cancer type 2 susceptibility protein [Nematolebias whitei]
MDLSVKTMHDTFKDEIWKELGPLNPNWFEVLTAQTSPKERIVADKDDLCANQEGNFKTPSEKTAVDSQLFSTPNVFRHSRVVSPETKDEQSFTNTHGRGSLPWTATQSPCLFQVSGQGVPGEKCEGVEPQSEDSFDIHSTPDKSMTNYVKHISESLGAQINPDISWTSSLNTPPAVPSTLILSKPDESPCPLSVTADRHFVFVRKLFPSLSKASSFVVPKNKTTPSVSQDAVSSEAWKCLQTEGVCQQKPPDAVEDEVCYQAEENLDGAKNMDSAFFANSSSALRKVKPVRVKRKQLIQAKEKRCSVKAIAVIHNSSSSEDVTADLESGRVSLTPLAKTEDPAVSQWSPLNLSEIPFCTLESNILTKQQQGDDTDPVQLFRPSMTITDPGFNKKKRKFVYTIPTMKRQVQEKESQSLTMDPPFGVSDSGQEVNVQPLEKASGACCSTERNTVQNQRQNVGENLPSSGGAKVQDFDMSLLCKEFAQDFSQGAPSGHLDKLAKATLNDFFPAACLSAIKHSKQKVKQADLQETGDIGNRRQTCSVSNVTITDSGLQSGVTDVTHMTASSVVLPHSEIIAQSRQCMFSFTKEEIEKEHMEVEENATVQKCMKRPTLDSGKDSESLLKNKPTCPSSSAEEVVYKSDCISLGDQICDSLPKKTDIYLSSAYSSGFKTASDKGIHISSANLKRAKSFFDETEGKRTLSNQSTTYDHSARHDISLSSGSLPSKTNSNQLSHMEKTFGNVSSQLTASEKADVTELCSLLEKADSQFEFAQSKTVKQIDQDDASRSQKPHRELDPDFLAGIDFDDSFNSDGGKHSSVTEMLDKMALVSDQSTSSSTALKNENASVTPFSENVSKDKNCHMLTGPGFHRAECGKASELNTNDPLMLALAFTTAGGNTMRVSKKCLSKARALFADLEENPTDQKPPDNQNDPICAKTDQNYIVDFDTCKEDLKFTFKDSCHVEKNVQDDSSKLDQFLCSNKQLSDGEKDRSKSFKNNKMDTQMFQSDFHMASGKDISISAKCMQQADAFFKYGTVMEHEDDMSYKNIKGPPKSIENKKSFSKYTNLQTSEESNVNAGLTALHTKAPCVDGMNKSSNGPLALKHPETSEPFSAPADGFCTASGKKVSVSANSLKRAECLLNPINTHEDLNVQLNQKENAKSTGNRSDEGLNAEKTGFQTASGNKVAISSAALKKAKAMLKEYEGGDDEMGISLLHPKREAPATSPPMCNSDVSATSGKSVVPSEDLQTNTIFPEEKHEANTEKRHCGFTTAGGAKVCVSQKNLLKAKDLFKDLDDLPLTKVMQESDAYFECDVDGSKRTSAKSEKDSADVGEEENRGKLCPDQSVRANIFEEPIRRSAEGTSKQEKAFPQQNGGFQTASGKRVNISSKALKRAKTLLSDCEGVENKTSSYPMQSKVGVLPCRNAGFLSGRGQPVSVSSEALEKAKALFSDVGFSSEIPDMTMKSDKKQNGGNTKEKIHCGFTTAGGAKVHVSEKNLFKAKLLFEDFDSSAQTSLEADVSFTKDKVCTVSSNSKRSSGSKSKALFSEGDNVYGNIFKPKPVTRNISDEPENGFTQDLNEQVKQKEGALLQQCGGFQTASGKTVAVSSEALTRAKTLLNENEGAEDNIHVLLPFSKIPNTEAFPLKNGFSSASGKPVTFSSETLQKAKAFFSDTSLSTNIPSLQDSKRSDEKHAAQRKADVHCGFTTAGGGKVLISEKSLLKAKHFFKEFTDGEHHGSFSHSPRPQNPAKQELSEAKDVERTNNVAPAGDGINAKRSDPCDVRSFSTTAGVDDILEESSMLDCHFNQMSYSKKAEVVRANESTDLNLQLLNLTGCTETQHKFIAQEALDCTKALLEDEVLAGQNLPVTSEDTTLPPDPKLSSRSAEEDNGSRKRFLEVATCTGQPPSKRRLLDEFDRTVDSSKGSALQPVKSSPTGFIKDRGVFKYSASLRPNITNPHSGPKHFKHTRFQNPTPPQHSAPRDGRASHSKMLVFVPPFIRNAIKGMPKNPEPKENSRTPVFVPPFKKQRLQDSSSKQQEEDQRHVPSTVESNSNTYVPPAVRTQTADVVASVESENPNMSNIQGVPVNTEVNHSEAEASVVVDSFSKNPDGHQNIELARAVQDMRIRKKKRQNIRPLPGSLFLTKTSGIARIPLKVAVNGKNPAKYNPKQLYEYGVQKNVSEVTSETAESFCFNLLQFVKQETFIDGGGVHLADGGWLIPSNDWTAGKEEFYRALCDTPGVDPKLISEAWVSNHYRWIVWKQASMEKSFPETMGSLCLTPEQVLLHLKYRYDVEVDHSHRPALRKIMEKDDAAAKTLVLCVCEVVSRGHCPNMQSRSDTKTPQRADANTEASCAVVQLTDGWYAIRAQLDEPLTAMLHKGLLTVGVKLIIHGAQLMGSQDACSPLEAPDSLMLKICANSSRRARWDAKLGFHRDPRPFLLPLSSLYSSGGPVGCVDVVILRSYPIQWMERKADRGVVFRSSRAEEKELRRYNNHKQTAMEALFAKIQAEFEKEEKGNGKPQQRRQSISHQDFASLQDGEELYEAVGDDPAYLEVHLSEQQSETLHAYRRSLMEKKQAELQNRYRRALEAEDNKLSCPKREVTPVWRLYIADSKAQSNHVYQLNLWRPSSDLQSLLKEGCRYKVYNLVASAVQKRSGIETLQLTGTKKTQFQDLQVSQEWLSDHFQPRVSTNFVNLQNAEFLSLCEEVDLTGYVISVIDEHGSSPAFYLADGKLNFVKVRCFNSLSQASLDDVIKPRTFLALSNLQLRGQSLHPTPVVYAGDLTVFSTNPKDLHLLESLNQLKTLVQSRDNFFEIAEEKLSLLNKSDGTKFISSPSLQLQTPVSEADRKQDSKTSVTFQKLDQSLGSFTPISRNPPAGTSSSEQDTKSLKRQRALDYLSRIPSPPPLSHLASTVSPFVNKTFNPPRRSGLPSTSKSAQAVLKPTTSLLEAGWVNDEELAMIDTQALLVGDLL